MKKNKLHKTNTYISIILLIALGIVFITACASTGQGKSEGMEVIYETDFSADDGAFRYGDGEINEIQDGILHLKKGAGEVAWAGLDMAVGNNSITTFRIKFGQPVEAHINFLMREGDRLLLYFGENSIHYNSYLDSNMTEHAEKKTNLKSDSWYEITVSIIDYKVTVSIDDVELGTVAIDNRLPMEGNMGFECHEEYWVDDLRIVKETSGRKDEHDVAEPTFEVKYEEIGRLMKEWEDVIRNRDHDHFAQLLWPEAELRFTDRNGRRTDFHGQEAIGEFRLVFFEELRSVEQYRLPEPDEYFDNSEVHQFYWFRYEDKKFGEGLSFENRNGIWKIGSIWIELWTPGPMISNRYQAIGDKNKDGFIQDDEWGFLYSTAVDFFREPHPASGPLDDLFDEDNSGSIDKSEIRLAGEILFSRGFRYLSELDKGWGLDTLNLNRDDQITNSELELISGFMIGVEDLQRPRQVKTDLDRWMDKNGDGQVDNEEIAQARDHFLNVTIRTPCPDALFLAIPRSVSNYLDELADGNGDGKIDQYEHDIILQSLSSSHDVDNYLERSLDLQHDGHIDLGDIRLALQASAMGKGIFTAKAEPPYPVVTPMDSFLDPSGDGFVDQGEIDIATAFLAGDSSVANRVSKALRGLTDCNDDGRIETWEIEEAGTVILHPHPVNRDEPLDKEGDVNRDGFIDPDELGISAGVTGKGEAPTLDERIRLVRHQLNAQETEKAAADTSAGSGTGTSTGFQSEYYRRLGKIQDRKLAVISLATETAHVDEETASGIIVFVENAFVNVGKVRVVDRKNIEDILSEYKFQSSGLVDENTAIEIGKLSGADIIVMGSINRVGGIFYLNIKLIDVKTAEIIGSNIAQAKDATGFLDMCNQVVYMLF